MREIIPFVSKQIVRYGTDASAQVRAENVRAVGAQMHFDCVRSNGSESDKNSRMPIVLNLPGMHNVLNALAAIAVATELGVEDAAMQKALAEFNGVGRRFQRYGEVAAPAGGNFTLIDDYGHHPVEMAATLAAARGAFPGTPSGAGFSATSLHAHAGLLRRFRARTRRSRCALAG